MRPVVVAILLAAGLQSSVSTPSADVADVSRVWDAAVAAKGGRARLGAIRNMVLSSQSARRRMLKTTTVIRETLIEPPGRVWAFVDSRPSKIGFYVELVDVQRGYHQIRWDTGTLKPADVPDTFWRDSIQDLQLTMWLETQSARPNLRATRRARWGGHSVALVDADLGGRRLSFWFDGTTMMLLRYIAGAGSSSQKEREFSDYAMVEGIWLPRRITNRERGLVWHETISYEVNVDYASGLFDEPPSLARGPKGWRPLVPTQR